MPEKAKTKKKDVVIALRGTPGYARAVDLLLRLSGDADRNRLAERLIAECAATHGIEMPPRTGPRGRPKKIPKATKKKS